MSHYARCMIICAPNPSGKSPDTQPPTQCSRKLNLSTDVDGVVGGQKEKSEGKCWEKALLTLSFSAGNGECKERDW